MNKLSDIILDSRPLDYKDKRPWIRCVGATLVVAPSWSPRLVVAPCRIARAIFPLPTNAPSPFPPSPVHSSVSAPTDRTRGR